MPPAKRERTDVKITRERAVLAAVHLPESRFDERDPLGELRALAESAGARVVGELIQRRQRPEAGTYMGSGKVEELKAMCDELDAGVVIFDHELSPKQIAKIEETIGRKVLDRSELILDIFATRATTHQARLAVELAQLEYTYPRLRAMWTHLERIVGPGGIGGIGTRGPGEQQLEIDRRIVQRKRLALSRELEEIYRRKEREVAARNLSQFTIGLVGYTNAGKSTLFNLLTEGGAYASDRLFATLVTRTREWKLGGGVSAMLSDTVGFVRDLPHHLIASFRATLEEAMHADVLLVVLDVSDPSAELQYDTVMSTLDELGKEATAREPAYRPPERVVLLNKCDRLRDNSEVLAWQSRAPGSIAISATNPDDGGIEQLREAMLGRARGPLEEVVIELPLSAGKQIDRIETQVEVLGREYGLDCVRYHVRIGSRQLAQLRALGGSVAVSAA